MNGKETIIQIILTQYLFIRTFDISSNQKLPGVCDQHCTNLKGTYQCSCDPGYQLKHDNHSCKAMNAPNILDPPSLLFASSTEVKLAYLENDGSANAIKGRYWFSIVSGI